MEIFGIEFKDDALIKADTLFDYEMDEDDSVFLVSKKEYQHEEDGLNFKYRYCIDGVWCDGKFYYSLNMVIAPESITNALKNDVCSFSGTDEPNYYDICSYGLNVMLGNTYTDGDECDHNMFDKIASVVDVIDSLRGFYLDKPFNRIGTNGWQMVKHCVNGDKLF